jgi:hypothetical protein
MVTATLLVDLKDQITKTSQYRYNQIASTALMGSASALRGKYDETKTYNLGDKCIYITDSGEILIIVCQHNGVTGPFDPMDWEEWNIMDELQGLYEDHIVLSWNRPSLRRNRVWLKIREDSIVRVQDEFGEHFGLLLYNNLIVSKRRPVMNLNTVWGQITDVVK